MTCPYHLSLPSLIFIPNRSTLTVPLINSFLILSFLVTPITNLNIFISATFISSTCFFVTATASTPYTIAGLTTELYTFPFIIAGNLLPHITLDTFRHPLYPACSEITQNTTITLTHHCLHSLVYLPLTTSTFFHS